MATQGVSTMASVTNRNNFQFKVVLLGEGAVGKTSLTLRYVENKFNDEHLTTVQASYLNKKINVGGKRINLSIWDTAGQEKFHALGPIYYRDSNGAILVYDITDQDSFQKVKNWVKELKRILGNDVSLVIAGNKLDLEKQRTVPVADAEEYARSVGAKHFPTSAKLNRGIEEMFLDLTQRMLDAAVSNEQSRNSSTLGRGNTRRQLLTIDDEPIAPKSGCCG